MGVCWCFFPSEEQIIYMYGKTVEDPNVAENFHIKEFIEYGYGGMDATEWNDRTMYYTVGHPTDNITTVSLECDIRMSDKKARLSITSYRDDNFVVMYCAAALPKKFKKSQDMLNTILNSITISGWAGIGSLAPKDSDPKKLAFSRPRDEVKLNRTSVTKNKRSLPSAKKSTTQAGRTSAHVSLKKIQQSGSSFILQSTGSAPSNAVAAGAAAIRSAAEYFDASPKIDGGIGANNNKEAQLFFTARKNGVTYKGLAVSGKTNNQTGQTVTLFCDKAAHFQQSLPDMLNDHGSRGASTSQSRKQLRPEDLQWQWHQCGSGRVKMPQGWKITLSDGGMVGGSGPQGGFTFGFNFQVRYHGMFDAMVANDRNSVLENYQPPLPALVNVYPRIVAAKLHFAGLEAPRINIKVLDHRKIAAPQGQEAEYILCRSTINGKKDDNFALVVTSPAGGTGMWMYYQSSVSAPVGQLETNLPVLMEIWASWETNPQIFRQRINQALRDMNIATETMQETIAARNKSIYNMSLKWDEYIRGVGHLLNTDTGKLFELDLYKLESYRDNLNDAAGYQLFRVFQPSEMYEY